MENKQINQLMVAMAKTGITELELEQKDVRLKLVRQSRTSLRSLESLDLEDNPMGPEIEKHRAETVVVRKDARLPQRGQESKDDAMSTFVTAPMVGTIYHSSSPNDPPFIKVGDKVEKNTVVCIIEAMKVMNEVKAQVSGTVAEILVDNASPVEFGTKIVRVVPAA